MANAINRYKFEFDDSKLAFRDDEFPNRCIKSEVGVCKFAIHRMVFSIRACELLIHH